MKVLFVASEGLPFVKNSALADMIGCLPKELKKQGIDVRVMLPKYRDIPKKFKEKMTWKKSFTVPVAWRNQLCDAEELIHDDIPYYFLDNNHYFNRKGLYGFDDDAERYTFFCYAALEALPHMDFKPDIIHCYDWQTGILSVLLKAHYMHYGYYEDIHTVFTVYNLKDQGIFIQEVLDDLLSLGKEYFTMDGIEFYGQVNYLKAGVMFSDIITTVSKTYAEEIQDPAFGEKLDGVFRKRKEDLYGILNGIDHTVYNPNSDPDIFINYQRSIKKKQQNKIKLQKLLGLPVTKEIPLISIMFPLISTKGLDLICCCLEEMLSMNIQVVVLGKGDHEYESKLQTIAKQYDEKISVNISFNESLARKIYAGSDMFLMPALFDPYGTEQLIALRYGSIPIVIESGGLKDGIQPFDKNTGEGNGFSFTDCNVHHLINTVKRAVDLFNQKEVWDKIVRNALKTNYSYRECANQYADLYKSLLDRQ